MKTDVIARQMSDSELQDNIIQLAHVLGWLVMHTRPSLNRRGQWATQLSGDPGFPDLVLAGHGTTIFAELKREKGKLTSEQNDWYGNLTPPIYVWRPSQWLSGEIERILRKE